MNPDMGVLVAPVINVVGVVTAAESHDWQHLAALVLPFIAYGVRRLSSQKSVLQTKWGVAGVTVILTLIGAAVPALDTGQAFTRSTLIAILTTAATTLLAQLNPTTPPASLPDTAAAAAKEPTK